MIQLNSQFFRTYQSQLRLRSKTPLIDQWLFHTYWYLMLPPPYFLWLTSYFQRWQILQKRVSLFSREVDAGRTPLTLTFLVFLLQNKHCIYSLSPAFMDILSFLFFRSVYVHNTCLSGKHISHFFSSPKVDIYIISLRVGESYQNLATYKVNTH